MALLPQVAPGRSQFFDGNGEPLVGGTVDIFVPSTTTRVTTYQDPLMATLNENPVPLDGIGSAAIWYSGLVRMVVRDAAGNQIYDQLGGTTGGDTGTSLLLADLIESTTGTAYQVGGRATVGDGYQGLFIWTMGNQSANVTNDPSQGVWVAPSSRTDGSQGAWKRSVSSPVNLMWWGIDTSGTVANDSKIVACFAYIAGLYNGTIPASVRAATQPAILPPGLTGFSTAITMPGAVSLSGSGSNASQFFALSSGACIIQGQAQAADVGSNYCVNHFGWGVHGNNIATSALFEYSGVGGNFFDVRMWWGKFDGFALTNAQNNTFTNCSSASNGDGVAHVGANFRFTAGSAGNVVTRSEWSHTANVGVIFGGNTNDNTIVGGEVERFKGQDTSEYYPSPVPPTANTTVALVVCDGAEGAQPSGSYNNKLISHEGSYYACAGGQALPMIIMKNGSSLIISDLDYIGDDEGTYADNTVFCQFGPNDLQDNVNTIFIGGTNNVRGQKYIFVDACASAGKAFAKFAGGALENVNSATLFYSAFSGRSAENQVTTELFARGNLTTGQLTFPATQNPSLNPNTLDDYQEGVGGVSLAIGGSSVGITYSAGPFCNFVKVGQLIFLEVNMTISSTGGLTGALSIAGLPEISTNQQSSGSGVITSYGGITLPAGTVGFVGRVPQNQSHVDILLQTLTGVASATDAILTGGSINLQIDVTYQSLN